MNVVCNSVVVIFPPTTKLFAIVALLPIVALPLTIKKLSIETPVFTIKPLFGEIFAIAEPDFS